MLLMYLNDWPIRGIRGTCWSSWWTATVLKRVWTSLSSGARISSRLLKSIRQIWQMCSRDWRYLVLSAIDSMDFLWIKLMKSLSCWCYCPPGADTWLEASILSTSQSTSVPRPTKGVSKHGGWKASLWTHRFYTWSLWLVFLLNILNLIL